jgi:DNA-binding GntR family transcriptional regulator
MDVLRRRGLIESRRGIGPRVLSRASNLAEIFSATDINDLAALVQNTELQIEQRSGFALSLALAARFGAEVGSRWFHLGCSRHDVRTDQVVAWTDTYIPRKYETLVGESRRLAGPLFTRILASEARPIGRIRQEIRAVALTKAISRQIEAEAGSPALEIQRSYYFDNNDLFQVAINTLPANRFHYASELVNRDGEIALDWTFPVRDRTP